MEGCSIRFRVGLNHNYGVTCAQWCSRKGKVISMLLLSEASSQRRRYSCHSLSNSMMSAGLREVRPCTA